MWRFVVPAAGIIAGLVMALSIALRDAPSSAPQLAPLAPAQAPADVVVSAPAPTTTAVAARAPMQQPAAGPTSAPTTTAVAARAPMQQAAAGPTSAPTTTAVAARAPMQQAAAGPTSAPTTTAVAARAPMQQAAAGPLAPPPSHPAAPQPQIANASAIAGGDLPLDSETAVLRRQRDALAAEVQRLQGELDRDQRYGSGIRKQDMAVRSNSARARRHEESTRVRDTNDPGFASVEDLLARMRRGSAVEPAPEASIAIPRASQPTGADPTAAWERLTAARHALAMGSFDEARSLLQATRIQLALRPITPDQSEPIPDGRGVAQQVGAALSNLDAGRQMQAIHGVDQAIARLTGIPDEPIDRGPALPASAYAGWPPTRPLSGQLQP